MSATQRGSDGGGNHNTPLVSFNNMSPQKQHAPNKSQSKEYEKLYNITKQLYSRHTKLISKNSDLERKHNLMKTKYIHLKAELLLKQEILNMYEQTPQHKQTDNPPKQHP